MQDSFATRGKTTTPRHRSVRNRAGIELAFRAWPRLPCETLSHGKFKESRHRRVQRFDCVRTRSWAPACFRLENLHSVIRRKSFVTRDFGVMTDTLSLPLAEIAVLLGEASSKRATLSKPRLPITSGSAAS